VKTPSGRWQLLPIPKHPRSGDYQWAKAEGRGFYLVRREYGKRRCRLLHLA